VRLAFGDIERMTVGLRDPRDQIDQKERKKRSGIKTQTDLEKLMTFGPIDHKMKKDLVQAIWP
jgi:hypothetical protein